MNLMAYDLHGSWEQDLGHHASLFPGPGDDSNDKKLTVVCSCNNMLISVIVWFVKESDTVEISFMVRN